MLPSAERRIPATAARFTPSNPPPPESRDQLVSRLANELTHYSAPRIHLLIIMILAGGAAFLASALLLWSPAPVIERMALRYPLAALCGYGAFVLLIRVWIALHRGGGDLDPDVDGMDVLNALDIDLPPGIAETPSPFGGGRGGGGASQSWDGASVSSHRGDSPWSLDFDVDVEALVWLAVAAVCALSGFFAIAYVVYMAPVLLAEVALDAAIISALYRRLRRDQAGYWLTTVLNRTWAPALVLMVFATLTGFALQQFAPEARSIGRVFGAI